MRRAVIAGFVGNGLEWYDFALYGTFSAVIGKLFFPLTDPYAQMIATYGVFAAGFLMRPVGAVLFGYLGDKYGRKFSLTLSILLMAIPTACIGFLPTYEKIGMWAPILLTIIRLLQGLSLAGQFSGSIAFVVEHAPVSKRGLIGSTTVMSLCVGMLLGAFVATLFAELLSKEDFESWGWRVPFIIGVVIAFVGVYIRNHTHESPRYQQAKDEGLLSEKPFADALKNHPLELLRGVGIYMSVTVPFYILTVFMNSYLTNVLHHTQGFALMLNTVCMSLLLFLVPFTGSLSDRIGRKRILTLTAISYLIIAYPVFWMITQPGTLMPLIGILILTVNVAFYIGPTPTVLVELFPTSVRYTGMALSYNLCAAVFGGSAPMVTTYLIKQTGVLTVPAFYIMLCALLSIIAFVGYHDRYREELH